MVGERREGSGEVGRRRDLKWLAMLILPRMTPEWFECYWNAVRLFRIQS